jgi:hypothetical protein
MIRHLKRATACGWILSLSVLALTGCDSSSVAPLPMIDSGSWYRSGFHWAHDGHPYESPNFIVYSDAASLAARREVAEIGEELLTSLKKDFELDETMFRFPYGQSKIHIYAYKDHYESDWGGWVYWGGLLIFSLDHPERTQFGHTELDNYRRVVTHELMHVVEGLLKGTDNPDLVDVWLTEGIAEYMAGGTAGGSITSLAKLEDLVANYGELNPIAMHQYRYPDIEGIRFYYYYPMFELAVTYLLDPVGAGRTKSSIRDIYLDARDGKSFATTFEHHLGLGLVEYEDQFFHLIRAYLGVIGHHDPLA